MSTVASPHILVVNDFPAVLALIRGLLEDEGYQVSTQTVAALDLSTNCHLAPAVIGSTRCGSPSTTGPCSSGSPPSPELRTRVIPVVLCTIPRMRLSSLQSRLDGLSVRVVAKPNTLDELLAATAGALAAAS